MKKGASLEQALQLQISEGIHEHLGSIVLRLAEAGEEIAALIKRGPLAGAVGAVKGEHKDGDIQKELDIRTHEIVLRALKAGHVAAVASEEADEPDVFDEDAPYVVAVDPLDGSSNIETNLTVGTIFAILPRNGLSAKQALLQKGSAQAAAGFIMYGPQTTLVLTFGQGTQIYTLDPASDHFVCIVEKAQIAENTQEYAVNASNARHWAPPFRRYVIDLEAGAEGLRAKDYNMRWTGSMVADAFRILSRGGVYLYPGDKRKGYGQGRLRLTYEANPIAWLMEQAGGAASDGVNRILDIEPESIHQRIPLIFGSAEEVRAVKHYALKDEAGTGERSPLFTERSLFRA